MHHHGWTWLPMFLGGMKEKQLMGVYVPSCTPTVLTIHLIVPTTPDTHTSGDGTYTGSGSEEQTLGEEIGVKEMVY